MENAPAPPAPPATGAPGEEFASRLLDELKTGIKGAKGDQHKVQDFLDDFIRRLETKENALVTALRSAAPLLRDASHGSAGALDANDVVALASRYAYHTHGPSGWRPGLPMGPGFRPPAPQDVHMRMSSLFSSGSDVLQGGHAVAHADDRIAGEHSKSSGEEHSSLDFKVRSLKVPAEDILGSPWTGKVDFGLDGLTTRGNSGGKLSTGAGAERMNTDASTNLEGLGASESSTSAVHAHEMDIDQEGGGHESVPAMPENWKPGDPIPEALLEAVAGEVPEMPKGWQPGDPIPGL